MLLISVVWLVRWSRTNTLSHVTGLAGVRFFANDEKAIRRPSAVIVAPAESPSPWVPSVATLIRSTPAPPAPATPGTVKGSAEAAPGSTVVTAQTTAVAPKAARTRLVALRFAFPLIFPPRQDMALLPGSPPEGHKHATAMALWGQCVA
ncbi:hypothetical protein [Streptomyces sp. NPDC005970]|uniref:hypothetical protein n=1 Tax=Streptomyces sp. NPDC005970 TaxID=3156723 RepID=UPI0033EFD9F9